MLSGRIIAGNDFDKDMYKIDKVAPKIIRDQKRRIISQDFQDYDLIIILLKHGSILIKKGLKRIE